MPIAQTLDSWTPAQVAKIYWTSHHGALSKLCFAEKILPAGKLFHKIIRSQANCNWNPKPTSTVAQTPAQL